MTEHSTRVKALRSDMGLNQANFAKKLGVAPARVSAWETGKETPSFENLIRLGNLALNESTCLLHDSLWFWEMAGLDTRNAMLKASEANLKQLSMESGDRTVPVLPLSGKGDVWYVDKKLIPDPLRAKYWSREPLGKTDFRYRPEVAILDTSAIGLAAHLGKVVLLESSGSSRKHPGLPWQGFHMGRLWLYAGPESVANFPPAFTLMHLPPAEEGFHQPAWVHRWAAQAIAQMGEKPAAMEKFWSTSAGSSLFEQAIDAGSLVKWMSGVEPAFRLRSYSPPLTKLEERLLQPGLSKGSDKENKAYVSCFLKVWERAKREVALPDGIKIVGRVLLWFRPDEGEQKA